MTAERFIYGLTGMTMHEAVQDFLKKQSEREEQTKNDKAIRKDNEWTN